MRKILFVIALSAALCLIACKQDAPQIGIQPTEESQFTGHRLSGSVASLVKIEVFSDFQCGGCRDFFIRTIQPIMKEYGDKVSIIYHEFPLSFHQYGRPAARYVLAADKLGTQKALTVFEAIFNDQAYWAEDGSLDNSVSRALSSEDFLRIQQILRNPGSVAEIDGIIEKELQIGLVKGVNSTPTIFVSSGGKEQKVEGVPQYLVMKQYLDSIIK